MRVSAVVDMAGPGWGRTWIRRIRTGVFRRIADHHGKLVPLVLTAALAISTVACERREPGRGTRPSDVAIESSGRVSETPSGPSISIHAGSDGPTVPAWSGATVGHGSSALFEVETTDADYWRLSTLDRFDGETWKGSDGGGSAGVQTFLTPATLPTAAGSASPTDAGSVDQTFRIFSDFGGVPALPLPPTADEIGGPIGEITWDRYRGQALVDGGLEEGMVYTVRSRIVVPTPEELDRVDHRASQEHGRWTQLPADLDRRVREIAENWTAGAASDYRKVLAIQERFQSGDFVYSTDVELPYGEDALLEFLTRTKAGFCQHYSSAMAVLVRELGLPARIAVGYRAGTRQDDGSFLVLSTDAHSWVEVFFAGYGWLPFEPEPGTTHPNAEPGTYLDP